MKGGSGGGASVSLWALCEGNLEGGGSFTGEPEVYVEESSGDGHFSIGAPLGNQEGGSFTGDFERWKRRVSLSVGAPWSTGNFENLLKEGSGC